MSSVGVLAAALAAEETGRRLQPPVARPAVPDAQAAQVGDAVRVEGGMPGQRVRASREKVRRNVSENYLLDAIRTTR